MNACPAPDVLGRIADGDDSVDTRDLQHASECSRCGDHVAFLRECIAAGGSDIAEEAAAVDALLEELQTERQSRWDRIVTADPRFHRAALARRMLVLALIARESDPRLALAYSGSATKVVEALGHSESDTSDLRFDAWRYHSMLLREMTHYHSCGQALAKAEEVAVATSDPELSLAIVTFGRALFAIEPDIWQPDEALTLLERADSIFERKDPARLLQTKMTRGILAFRAADFESAASTFAEVLAATPVHHEAARADASRNYLFNAVQAARDDDDLCAAVKYLEVIDERAGRYLAVLRDRWIRGLLSLNRHEFAEAIALLRETMRGFEAKGDGDTALRAGLDILRALLAAERYDEAFELARDLASRAIGLDKREPTRRRALTAEAVSYLREAAQRQLLTGDLANSVREYIHCITYQRPAKFKPPMLLHAM